MVWIKKGIILLFSILLLVGCGIENILENDESKDTVEHSTAVTLIADLKHTAHFRKGALEHILEGELNQKGDAVGFHYERLPTRHGNVQEGTATTPNSFGVYEAKVEVNGISKTSNHGKSTFFPFDWDTQQVIDAINEAYEERAWITGNTFEGLTKDGMPIRMYLDQMEKIISAFPVY